MPETSCPLQLTGARRLEETIFANRLATGRSYKHSWWEYQRATTCTRDARHGTRWSMHALRANADAAVESPSLRYDLLRALGLPPRPWRDGCGRMTAAQMPISYTV